MDISGYKERQKMAREICQSVVDWAFFRNGSSQLVNYLKYMTNVIENETCFDVPGISESVELTEPMADELAV